MKTTFVNGACVIIESDDVKIICDPWITGEAYYGSWSIYPPLQIEDQYLEDIDYIYISHIHPDHLHPESLEKIDKKVPVLIHSFEDKFLKFKLEKLGRKVIELKHGESHNCGANVRVHIYAADNCVTDNTIKFLGLGKTHNTEGQSTGIDTACVVENGEQTILNVNDCPFDLTRDTISTILKKFGRPDMLLFPYNAAGSFPQCFNNYSHIEKIEKAEYKSKRFLEMGLEYLNFCQPKNYLPFAGGYTLCGDLSDLNKYRGNPDQADAVKYYQEKYELGDPVLLNQLESFDLSTGKQSRGYEHICSATKKQYCETVLKNKKYDYQDDPEPALEQITNLIPACFDRLVKKADELNFKTNKIIYIELPNHKMVKIDVSSKNCNIIDNNSFKDSNCVVYKLDYKLLYRILQGPRYAHWDNATVGSHVQFYRNPDVYEKKVYWCMNYFHQ